MRRGTPQRGLRHSIKTGAQAGICIVTACVNVRIFDRELMGDRKMAVPMKKLIDLLNMDLELEYSAAIQYINQAAVMTGAT